VRARSRREGKPQPMTYLDLFCAVALVFGVADFVIRRCIR
jgi:hypothetical protein